MTNLIIDLISNKWVIASFAALIGLITAYFKGSSAAKKSAEAERALEEKALQSRLRAAEAKNLHLEKKGQQENEKINTADSISRLIGLFDALQRKGPSGSSDKNPK